MGGSVFYFSGKNLNGKCGAAEAAENFKKFQNFVKYTLKRGKQLRYRRQKKMYDTVYFFCCNSW